MRICSLLPGATEMVAALGRASSLVGISHECDEPAEVRRCPIVVRPIVDADRSSADIDEQVRVARHDGRALYQLDVQRLAQIQPDLIITQDLCDVCAITPAQIHAAIQKLPVPPRMLTLNPATLNDVIADVERIGEAIGCLDRARAVAADLRRRLTAVRERVARTTTRPRVACLEWLDPLYVAGHWIPDMVACAGGVDVLGTAGSPSVTITWSQLKESRPELIVIMPCGFTIERTRKELDHLTRHEQWEQLPAVQHDTVFLVEASAYFSRPGPRLIDGVEKLAELFHPSLADDSLPAGTQRLAAPASPTSR